MPRAGFEDKVFYVWFDAPIGYIAATQEWADQDSTRRDWHEVVVGGGWRDVQLLGKDNVPFHAVSFPATLLGSGEPWKTVDVIKGFHWLAYQGGKFSTSRKRGISPTRPCELPADALALVADRQRPGESPTPTSQLSASRPT